MPRGLLYQFALPEGDDVVVKYQNMGLRLRAPEDAFYAVMDIIEAQEIGQFQTMAPRYNRTGATRDSLTFSGSGGIRHVTAEGFEFGSEIPYVRNLRASDGHNPVLISPQKHGKAWGRTMMDFVTGDYRRRGARGRFV